MSAQFPQIAPDAHGDPAESVLEENRRLRRTMRDLVALSTLPAVWRGLGSEEIAGSLSDVLLNTLSLDLVYVRLADRAGKRLVEALRSKHRDPARDEAAKASLAAVFMIQRGEAPTTIPNPFGPGTLRVAVVRFGIGDDHGVLVACSANADFPTEQDRLLLGVGANQTAIVVQRRQMEEEVHEQRNARLAVTQALTQAATVADAGQAVLRAVCENLDWDAGYFWLASDQDVRLECEAHWHKPEIPLATFTAATCNRTFASGEGLPGRVWASRASAWISNLSRDANFPRHASAAQDGLQSAFACPVIIGERVLGVVEFFTQASREPDADLLEMMSTMAGNVGQFVERKIAEDELRRSEEELAEFFENATVGLHWVGPDGKILRANRTELDMLGYAREEYVGRSIADFHVDQDVIGDILARLRAGEKLAEHPARLRCKDGSIKDVLIDSSVMWNDGRFIHTRCFTRDITERRRAEIALAAARSQLEHELRIRVDQLAEADRRKDEFLATLAHELRNPLAPLRNSLEILKMPRVDATMIQQTRGMMERQVHHLVRLVDDLLDVSRVMRGKIELRKEPLQLATVVARAVETVQPLVEMQRHRLELSLPNESLLVDADPVRLAQVIGNLLTNSVKYTEAGGHIWIAAARDRDEVVLQVRDDGIGIAPDMLPHVFELFVQADHTSTKAQGGLGVGLTLAKNLTQMHGGSIEAHSAGLGKGCELIVRLPLMQPRNGCMDRVDAEQPYEAPASGHRLLVVDDNQDAARSLAMLLRLRGHEVRIAHDGAAALEIAPSYLPKVVFLDIGMPGMDGYEVARRLREHRGLESVVLAALTGWGQQEDRRRTTEAGFDYHLVKPADAKTLDDLLDALE
jgi:PAS domain S-box-containing protein